MKLEKNVFYKKWSPRLIFLNEKKIIKNSNDFWNRKLTFKVQCCYFRMNRHSSAEFIKNPLSMLILGQKSCFLRPTIFEIPQPNWYYSRTTVYKTGVLPANPCQKCPGIFLANPNFFLFSLGCSYFQLYPRIGNVNDWQQN